MTTSCQELIGSLPKTQPCLLFNTLSINLENHDDNVFLKEKFESIYTKEFMMGSNRELKQFLRETYSTNLNIEQLRVISPHLKKLLKFQQLLTDVTGTTSLRKAISALNALGLGTNAIQPMQLYKTALLYEIYQQIKGSDPQKLSSIQTIMENIHCIDSIESKSLELCKSILRDHSVCYFKKPASQLEINEEQIFAVYGYNEMTVSYTGNQTHKNIDSLWHSLRNCDAYLQHKETSPAIDESLSALKRNLIDRLNRYSRMRAGGYDSREMINESVDYFEKFVTILVYSEIYNLTDNSIRNSLNNLAAFVGRDLDGCNEGFSGRVQSLLQPLLSGSGNKIKDCIQKFLKDSITASLAGALGCNSESSMLVRCQTEVNNFLGLAIASAQTQTNTFESIS